MRNIITYRPSLATTSNWLDSIFGDDFTPTTSSRTPHTDVRETKKNYLLEIELPGLTEKDFKVNVEENLLTIESEDWKTDSEETTYLIQERRGQSFKRSFVLPRDVETDAIAANFKQGLLTLTVPKSAKATPKQVKISA